MQASHQEKTRVWKAGACNESDCIISSISVPSPQSSNTDLRSQSVQYLIILKVSATKSKATQ